MRELSLRAQLYISTVIALGAGTLLLALPFLPSGEEQWARFVVLTTCAAVAQVFQVGGPRNEAYQLTLVFFFAGLLLLPPGGLALLVILTFIPQWLVEKKPWHIQSFNVGMFLLVSTVARLTYDLSLPGPDVPPGAPGAVLAAVLAAAVFTLLNHLLLAAVLWLARGHHWRATGLFEPRNLLLDGALACLGIITAVLWQSGLALVALIAAPLFLIYRALTTPSLQEMARTEPKTGLYNARHFMEVLQDEAKRATRFDRPLAVIMADLDLLRDVNNTYGHLAGDIVIKGVADVFRSSLRDYDVACRFGGEEFAILLPEADAQQGLVVAERLREAFERAEFVVPTSVEPIRATLSLGVAAFPAHGESAEEVLQQADLALIYSKQQGRNRVSACSPETQALESPLAHDPALSSLLAPLAAAPQRAAPDGAARAQARRGARRERPEPQVAPARTSASASGAESAPAAAPPPSGREDGRPSRRGRAGDLTWPVALLIAVVFSAGMALVVLHRPWEVGGSWLGLAALAVLTAASQSFAVETYGRGKVSVGGTFVLAGGFLFGVPAALLLALVLATATWVLRRGIFYRTLFDSGNTTLWAAAAVSVYHQLASRLVEPGPILLLVVAGIAAVAYYVVNVGLLSLVFALVERRSPFAIWDEQFRWMFAHYLVYGALALLIVLAYQATGVYGLAALLVPPVMMRYVMKQYVDHTAKHVAELKRMNQELTQTHGEVVRMLRELRTTYDDTLIALSTALDSRDTETEGHSRRVVQCTSLIARQLGYPESQMGALLNGALLHDVGKIGVSDAIMRKPGPLNDEEWAAMRQHPDLGHDILRGVRFLADALPVIRHHHERYDGAGYPGRLSGAAIPLAARIFAVADAFDAMTSDRPYRAALSLEAARAEIIRHAGRQFDPEVVAAFLRVDPEELLALSGQSDWDGSARLEQVALKPLRATTVPYPA